MSIVIIFRYFTKQVLTTLLGMTVILLAIFLTNQFIQYLNSAAQGVMSMKTVLLLMLLQVPFLLAYLLPLALYLGILVVYGRLCVDHEMVVLHSCGVSKATIISMTLRISCIIAVLVGTLMLTVEPRMEKLRHHLIDQSRHQLSIDKLLPGRFQSFGAQRVLYTGDVLSHRELKNVFMASCDHPSADEKDSCHWSLVMSEKIHQLPGPDGDPYIDFEKGYRYVGTPGSLKYSVVSFDHYRFLLSVSILEDRQRPKTQTTQWLWHHLSSGNRGIMAEWQWRIAMPFSVLLLGFIAVPLSMVNPRHGKFAKLLPAVLLYVLYANMMFVARAWFERGVVNSFWGEWWVLALLFLLGLVLNIQYIGWRRVWYSLGGRG